MLRDDRIMSILTGLIIIVAMVVLAQKTDSILNFAFREEVAKIAPQNDVDVVFAGESKVIDVLANDENAAPDDGARLNIVVAPSCGAAEPTEDGILYISNDRCVGPQLFAYCVSRGDECPTASVTVNVAAAPAEEPEAPVVAARPAPAEAPSPPIANETAAAEPPAPARARPTAGEDAGAPPVVAASPAPEADDEGASEAPAVVAEREPSGPSDTLAAADEAPSTRLVAAPTSPARTAPPDPTLGDDDAEIPQVAATRFPGAPEEAPAPGASEAVIAAIQPIAPLPEQAEPLAPQPGAAPRISDAPVPAPRRDPELPEESEPALADLRLDAGSERAEPAAADDGAAAASASAGSQEVAALPRAAGEVDWTPGARPDVSALAEAPPPPETPPTEIATLIPDDGERTIDKAQEAAADEIRADAESRAASCPATIESTAGPGGSSLVTVTSDCRAGDAFELVHAGLRFGAVFDGNGVARVTLPVIDDKGGVAARFLSGDEVAGPLNVNWRELAKTQRVAVAWDGGVDLNLHAFEYAASFGEEGHVWEESPRGFRLVRRSGGGYLDSFPAQVEDGQSIEVYTFWISRRSPRGVARIALDYASRGGLPEGAFCADGPLASPGYVVVRSTGGVAETPRRGRFAPAPCGQTLDDSVRYASGALPDVEIE